MIIWTEGTSLVFGIKWLSMQMHRTILPMLFNLLDILALMA